MDFHSHCHILFNRSYSHPIPTWLYPALRICSKNKRDPSEKGNLVTDLACDCGLDSYDIFEANWKGNHHPNPSQCMLSQ